MTKENKESKRKTEESKIVLGVPARGRIFEGTVVKKFHKRVVIEFERTVYVIKYERFYRKKTRIHARVPEALISQINVGDYVRARECRPLSKIIHSVVTDKLKGIEENAEASKLLKKNFEIESNKARESKEEKKLEAKK